MANPARKAIRRVLIYRLGSLGDTVVALPALHLTERAFPEAERRMLTTFPPSTKAPPSSAVLEHTGLVHGYLRYAYGTRNLRELFTLWWQIRRWRPEVLVYMGGTRGIDVAKRDALFFRVCGITTLVGVPLNADMQSPRPLPSADQSVHPPIDQPAILEHECSRLVRNLAVLGHISLDGPKAWDLRFTAAERQRAEEVLLPAKEQPVIAVSVGTKMQSKDWGLDNWSALIRELSLLYPTHALALCGAPEEFAASEQVAIAWRSTSTHAAINLCGQMTPRESAALFARAEIFIGHDSGPMHLAAAVQTPCVAVFSARNLPNVWFPYGSHHRVVYHHVSCQNCDLDTCIVEQKRCIRSITVAEVLREVAHVLPGGLRDILVPLRPA